MGPMRQSYYLVKQQNAKHELRREREREKRSENKYLKTLRQVNKTTLQRQRIQIKQCKSSFVVSLHITLLYNKI